MVHLYSYGYIEEKKSSLKATEENLESKKKLLNEYKNLLNCIQSNYTYDGSDQQVKADYGEYDSSRKKAAQLAEQYRLAYNEAVEKINNQVPEEITAFQVENAKSEADSMYASMVSLQSAFLADIRSQTLLLENQLVTLSSQVKLVQDESFTDETMKNSIETEYQNISAMLNEYNKLKNAVEQGYDFYSENETIQNIYNQYISNYNIFRNEYDEKNYSMKIYITNIQSKVKILHSRILIML